MNAQPHRGVAWSVDASAAFGQYAFDVTALDGVERIGASARHRACRAIDAKRIVELERALGTANHRSLDYVLELADVAGPVMELQRLHDVWRHAIDAAAQL